MNSFVHSLSLHIYIYIYLYIWIYTIFLIHLCILLLCAGDLWGIFRTSWKAPFRCFFLGIHSLVLGMWQVPFGIIWTYPCFCGLVASISPQIIGIPSVAPLSIHLSINQSIYPSIHPSIYLSLSCCSSLCKYIWTWVSLSPICFHTCLPSSLQVYT